MISMDCEKKIEILEKSGKRKKVWNARKGRNSHINFYGSFQNKVQFA